MNIIITHSTMNSDLLNIMSGRPETQGPNSASYRGSGGDDDGVDDIRDSSRDPTNYFGLNLGRSQSAAPETWEYAKIASSTKSTVTNGNGIFGGASRFFDEEEEDRDALVQSATRRPASTGVIGRPDGDGGENGNVDSILETLGLASLDSSGGQKNNTIMGGHTANNQKSIMEKIHEADHNKRSNYFTNEAASGNVFSNNQGGQMGVQGNVNAPAPKMAGQQYQGLSNQGGAPMEQQAAYTQHHYVQQTQTTPIRQVRHQGASQYDSQQQQQVYYQQQASTQSYHAQDYRTQQQANMNMMHGGVPQMNTGQQQTVYHINSPTAAPYGLEYQQQYQHGVPANHIILPQQQVPGSPMHGQPQYISIVPIQAGPHVIGGAPGHNGHAYAYVQYGDGMSQPTLVAGGSQATFVMGPNGPIAVSQPGVVPISTMNYNGHGASASGENRGSPTRMGSNTMLKTPDRVSGRKKNALASPRGKRMDKNVNTPSKLGPEASNLLNDIRAAKSRNQWTIHDIKGHIVEFCLDQNGSRFIQQRLEVADANEKNAVMGEIVPAIKDLQNDVFGNYVVQKLYEFGTHIMKKALKGTLEGNMLLLSLQMYGCRVVQKALESLAYDDLCELLQEFDSYVLTCIQDQNGNHVMQKCIEVMSVKAKEKEARTGEAGLSNVMSERIQFIVDDVLVSVKSLCCHPYGCRVLQRMLEHCVDSQKSATLDKIQLCHKALLDDQYGNYVIQHVLQYGRVSDRDSLLNIIVANDLLKLARQKFASNVVEKLLKYGNSHQRNGIVREMLKVVHEGESRSTVVLLMVRDAYANYVVQTAIDVVPEGNEKRLLLEELKANEVQLRNYTFAKHIVAKLGVK